MESSLQAECIQICTLLRELGMNKSELLILLLQVSCPGVPEIYSVASEVLGLDKWFEKKNDGSIREAMDRIPSDALAFRCFCSVRQIVLVLNQMTPLQLLHLSDKVIPPGTMESQVQFLVEWQEMLQHWSSDKLRELHGLIHATPVNLERQRMQEFVNRPEFLHITCQLVKLPVEQIISFHSWFCSLGNVVLGQLGHLLSSLDSDALIELRASLLLGKNDVEAQAIGGGPEAMVSVPGKREDLLNSLMSGFSPPAASNYQQAMAGGMKISVGSLELGAMPMEIGFDEFAIDSRKDLDPLMRNGLLNRSDSDPIAAVVKEIGESSENSSGYSETMHGNIAGGGDGGRSNNNNNNNNGNEMTFTPAKSEAMDVERNDDPDFEGGDEDDVIPPAMFQNAGVRDGNAPFQLRIVVQPSPKTVYQRILRPYPSVLLEGAAPGTNFFVEVTLCTNDSEESLSCLSGAGRLRISNGLFASFKKLKVTSTSQQIGSLLRLRFQLKSFNGTTFADVPGVVALSQPIEVFSHTHYLTNKKKGHRPAPPNITDIVPCTVKTTGGCKLVILGSNFIKCPQLKVKVGSVQVPANYHEQGTLWVILPPLGVGRYPVAVSNDGLFFAQSPVQVEYVM